MFKLKIISSTIRPGRRGPIVANWIVDEAKSHGSFNVETLDLGEIMLPPMVEPNHPVVARYEFDHTKEWSRKIDEADAFIFVTAEYNHTYPAPLQNALHYLIQEWAYKAAGIVSYGGVSAGTRAFKDLKSDLSTLSVVGLVKAVHIPFFTDFINREEEFVPNDVLKESARVMLDELARWTKGMQVIREDQLVEEE